MQSLGKTLAKQTARTVASRTIRNAAKSQLPTNSLLYKVGVSALIAGVGHFISKGLSKPSQETQLLEDGFDEPPEEIFEMTEKEMMDILHQRMLAKNT